jgi:hypothetical protein
MCRIKIASDSRVQIDIRFRHGFGKFCRVSDLKLVNAFPCDHKPSLLNDFVQAAKFFIPLDVRQYAISLD